MAHMNAPVKTVSAKETNKKKPAMIDEKGGIKRVMQKPGDMCEGQGGKMGMSHTMPSK